MHVQGSTDEEHSVQLRNKETLSEILGFVGGFTAFNVVIRLEIRETSGNRYFVGVAAILRVLTGKRRNKRRRATPK